MLCLNPTNAGCCFSDVEKILQSPGANTNLQKICLIHQANLTEVSFPVVDVDKFKSIADSSRLLTACGKVDPVKDCCHQVCQNDMLDAARKIAMKVCPWVFPDVINITRECEDTISNKTACCKAVYINVTHLQEQSFITNLQANKFCCFTWDEVAESLSIL